MRHAARTDGTQSAIVAHLRGRGASVYIVKLPVDLLVGFGNKTALVEIKDPTTRYGKKGANPNQASFMSTWKGGTVALIDSIEAADNLLGLMS